MSKITIIEGNANDKDNLRALMVKGEKGDDGVSPTVKAVRSGNGVNITATDNEGTTTARVEDGISPTVKASKTGGVTTITITDLNGTRTSKINDGEVTNASLATTLTNYQLKGDFAVLTGSITGDDTQSLTKDIAFPTGFDNNNCVVISSMFQRSTTQNGMWGAGSTLNNSSYVRGTLQHGIYLNDTGIHIDAKNILLSNGEYPSIMNFASSVSFNYKIVLMKIS